MKYSEDPEKKVTWLRICSPDGAIFIETDLEVRQFHQQSLGLGDL